jgi:Arm DNA-binding domain
LEHVGKGSYIRPEAENSMSAPVWAQVKKLAGPAEGRKDRLHLDDGELGLALRVSAKGSRTYVVQYTLNGVRRRMPLPASTLATARSAAAAILGDVAKGVDSFAERKQARLAAEKKATSDAFTLAMLLEQWRKLHLSGKSERYGEEAVRALRYAFPNHLTAPAAELDRAVVVCVLDDLGHDGSLAMANRTAAYGRAAYHWAVKRGSIASNRGAVAPGQGRRRPNSARPTLR